MITFWLDEIVLISGREGMIGIVKGGLVREMEKEGEGEKRERERETVYAKRRAVYPVFEAKVLRAT